MGCVIVNVAQKVLALETDMYVCKYMSYICSYTDNLKYSEEMNRT